MDRDSTDDSRFTVERLDLVPRTRLDGDKRRIILKVMEAIFATMDQRLDNVQELIHKNQRDLRKCWSRAERYKEIIETYQEASKKEDLTSVVKYYFALAKSDKLFLAQPEPYLDGYSGSRRPYDENFQTDRSKEERKQLEEDVAWLTSYKAVEILHSEHS
jgi:hypothetical protein